MGVGFCGLSVYVSFLDVIRHSFPEGLFDKPVKFWIVKDSAPNETKLVWQL